MNRNVKFWAEKTDKNYNWRRTQLLQIFSHEHIQPHVLHITTTTAVHDEAMASDLASTMEQLTATMQWSVEYLQGPP